MKIIRFFLLVLAFGMLACSQPRQPNPGEIALRIKVDGFEFDSLFFSVSSSQQYGAERNNGEWMVYIPDSLPSLAIDGYFTGWKAENQYSIIFDTVYNGKKEFMANILLSDTPEQYIHFLNKDSAINYKEDYFGKSIASYFTIEADTDSDIYHSIGFILDIYDWRNVDRHVALVSKYPDSFTLLQAFSNMYRDYSAYEQEKIFNCFSPRLRNTRLGQNIKAEVERALHFTHFDNIKLTDWKTGKQVPVMKDTTKYNLVIFSTSWCGPCRAEIPALKRVYADLKKNLDMVYISADKESGIEAWRTLMREEQIPWRSVLAYPQRVEVIKKYFVYGYPTSYLIHPDGQFEKIDIRIANQKARLYELVQKK